MLIKALKTEFLQYLGRLIELIELYQAEDHVEETNKQLKRFTN